MNVREYPLILMFAITASTATADTTISATEKFAWSANCGWISFVHDQPAAPEGVAVGEGFLSGLAYAANIGWINFGNANPNNGYSYSNTLSDHGVNHDGAGNLSGFAWSANTGWLNFGWADSTNPSRPYIDLSTGLFHGFAWSPNLGWINLGTGVLRTEALETIDSDNDGIADHWEIDKFGDLATADATSDNDGDGSPDVAEYAADSDPVDNTQFLAIVTHSYDLVENEVTLNFTTSPSRMYRIEQSADLGLTDPWTDSNLATFSPDPGSVTTRTLAVPGSSPDKYFYRAVAVQPLQQ